MALEYLTTWCLSPGVVCFLLLNVLVFTIALTSRAQQGGRAASRRRLARSASSMVLDRLRSFCDYMSPEAEEQLLSGAASDHQLAVPETAAATTAAPQSQSKPAGTKPAHHAAISSSENAEGGTAAGVRSMSPGETSACATESLRTPLVAAAPAGVAVVTAEKTPTMVALVRGPPEEEPVAEFVKSKHRARAHGVEGKAELNARAEQFIRQFRHELKLQRLDSILRRHHTHTLGTGSGAATSR